jgi:RNA polymerase-binding transcription factor DksA
MNETHQLYNQLERERLSLISRIKNEEEKGHVRDVVSQQLLYSWHSQLCKVSRAQDKCAVGEYGICTRCLQAIDAERLALVPFADMCVDCQRLQEGNAIVRYTYR